MTRIKTILHPTDFSEHSKQAFELACALARDYGARLVVMHVITSPMTVLGGTETFPPAPEELNSDAERQLLAAVQPSDPEIQVSHKLAIGVPADEIVREAGKAGSDLIVLGTHGRTGLSRLLMGSVAEKVLRKAPCPVLTVKSPVEAAHAPVRPAARERATITFN